MTLPLGPPPEIPLQALEIHQSPLGQDRQEIPVHDGRRRAGRFDRGDRGGITGKLAEVHRTQSSAGEYAMSCHRGWGRGRRKGVRVYSLDLIVYG